MGRSRTGSGSKSAGRWMRRCAISRTVALLALLGSGCATVHGSGGDAPGCVETAVRERCGAQNVEALYALRDAYVYSAADLAKCMTRLGEEQRARARDAETYAADLAAERERARDAAVVEGAPWWLPWLTGGAGLVVGGAVGAWATYEVAR